MYKKSALLIICIILIFIFTGCIQDKDNDSADTTREITLYFTNEQADKLVTEKRIIVVENEPIEEIILRNLQEGPVETEEGLKPTISPNIEILDVKVEEGTAYVNISSGNLTGGSTEEKFLISSIVMSLTELKHIEQVKFLIDGDSEGTLMGHYIIDEPFTREDIEY